MIPSEIASLPHLEELFVDAANLQSTIPSELARLPKLKVLHLERNSNLSGTIPDGLMDNTNLQILFISGSKISGTIPATTGNNALSSDLRTVALSHNRLSGTIPPWLATLPLLLFLDLSYNQLTGMTPEFPVGSSILEWKVSRNRLTGILPPSLVSQAQLEVLWISDNEKLVSDALVTSPLSPTLRDVSFFNTQLVDYGGMGEFCSRRQSQQLPDRIVGDSCDMDGVGASSPPRCSSPSCGCFTHCCFSNGTCLELATATDELVGHTSSNIFNKSADGNG